MHRLALLAVAAALAIVPIAAAEPHPGPGFSKIGNFGVAWSPDGRTIAFAGYAAGHAQIYAVDLAGTHVRRLTHDTANDFSPVWLRDGRLAFHGQEKGADFVAFLDRNGHTAKVSGLSGEVDWSRDGRRIVYTVRDRNIPQQQLWVANADGSGARMIVRDASFDGAHPDWSPDGRRIAYVGGANVDKDRTIHVVNADGSGDRKLTQGGHEWFPDWSPSGKRIAYAEGPFAQQHYNLALVNVDGTNAQNLTAPRAWDDTTPAWSPNGNLLAFTSTRSGNQEVWVVKPNGTQLRRVTFGGCTVIGSVRNDRLEGTGRRDVLCGFEGSDVLIGFGGNDKLVGGPGDDRLVGGRGDDVLDGEEGNDRLEAGAGTDKLDGGPGDDAGFADAADVFRAIEHAHGGRAAHPIVLPSAREVESQTRTAVRASGAHVVRLRVRVRSTYDLTVKTGAPARYLKYRVSGLMTRLQPLLQRIRFDAFALAIDDAKGRVFSYSQRVIRGGSQSTWYVRPGLINCVTYDFGAEINPDGIGPACPA